MQSSPNDLIPDDTRDSSSSLIYLRKVPNTHSGGIDSSRQLLIKLDTQELNLGR